MHLTAVLLRWYRSFNTATLGMTDPTPPEPWHQFDKQLFPFVVVPLDRRITCVVGANESGKSHLLSALSKVINGDGLPGMNDKYEIKDICRFCGFTALENVWPEIGVQVDMTPAEAAALEPAGDSSADSAPESPDKTESVTFILNGASPDSYATAYRKDVPVKSFKKKEWRDFAEAHLPTLEVLDANLALPNEIHIDELIDIYAKAKPKTIVDALAVQDLWREIESIEIPGTAVDAATVERISETRKRISKSGRKLTDKEQRLVHLLFDTVLQVTASDLQRMREYTNSERGYVSSLNDTINQRIDNVLDIARYWDQDEDFKLSVNYKGGTFHFQITDRTGSTYTFNERSSGLRFFLSYYIQAKALEKGASKRGAAILMDEPDSFLSASGQRSLLRVFDELVDQRSSSGTCQLLYTTHSPFLINRNFPQRVRLVRKGDGSEGTQYVQRAAIRRFEPVRTALSIDAADTLFLGSTNVILEGYSDLKLLTACIQRFGEPGRLDEMLDLNSVTIVAAGGAPYAAELVAKATKGDEKPPVVVVMLDGDQRGLDGAAECCKRLDPKQVTTLRAIGEGTDVFEVLEDLVPDELIDIAIAEAYASKWQVIPTRPFDSSTAGGNKADKLATFCREHFPALAGYEPLEIRNGVVDALVDLLADPAFENQANQALASNVRIVCKKINEMIEYAERLAQQRSLRTLVRQVVERFSKKYSAGASKGDVRKLLDDVTHLAFGTSDDFEATRQNVNRMLETLDAEAKRSSDPVDLAVWKERLERFKNEPWAKKLATKQRNRGAVKIESNT